MIKNIIKKYKTGSFRTSILFTGGNFIVAIIGALGGILYGRWINPEVLGEFNKYSILTGYLCFGIIFVDGAFQRHFPYYIGKGEESKAKDIASNAKWIYLGLVWMGVLIFSSLSIFSMFNGDINGIIGWFIQIPIFGVATYGLYLKILYRTNDDFLKLNKNMLITAGSGLASLPLVYFFKYFGLVARAFIQNSINIIFHIRNVPYKIKASFNKKKTFDLIRTSIPLQLPAYLDTFLLKSTISLVILNSLGEQALGVYTMALMLQGFLLVFSQSLNQIITTKLMLKYGSSESLLDTFKYVFKPTLLVSSISLAIVIVFIFTIQPVINQFLPKYIGSIIVLQILAFELVLSLVRIPFTLFISSLMYKEIAFVRVAKVILTLILLFVFHDTLVQIATVIISASLLNVFAGYILLYFKIKQ